MSQLAPSDEKTFTITYRPDPFGEHQTPPPHTVTAAYFVIDVEEFVYFKNHHHAIVFAAASDLVATVRAHTS